MTFYRMGLGWQLIARPLVLTRWKGGVWVRIFGLGLKVIDTRVERLPFSMREGIERYWMIGPFAVWWLQPCP